MSAARHAARLQVRIASVATLRRGFGRRLLLAQGVQVAVEVAAGSEEIAATVTRELSPENISAKLCAAGLPPVRVLKAASVLNMERRINMWIPSAASFFGLMFCVSLTVVAFSKKDSRRESRKLFRNQTFCESEREGISAGMRMVLPAFVQCQLEPN